MSQILGIDAGNTMIKAVLFDLSGRVLSVAECAGETHQPQEGYAERPVEDIWHGVSQAVSRCLQQAGSDPREVIAVGAAGHGNGLYALDKQQQPLFGIQSIDHRALARVQALELSGADQAIYRLSLQKPWPAATPVLISWIKQHQPDRWSRLGHLLCAKDVIAHFLSGAISADYSDAAGAGLIDYRPRNYSRELMALYDIEDALALLPPLRESCEVVGQVTEQAARLTGLPVGIPVVAGIFDVVASAVGSGVVKTGQASIVAGTWSINQVVVDKPDYLRPVFMNSIIEKDRFMAIEASATSAANLDWFLREFDDGRSGQGAARSSDTVAHVEPNAQLPLYHPYLYSGRKSEPAKAGFYGLGGWHTRADMLFALFEGVTFAHRAHVDRLRAAGIPFTQAILSGGAARSCIWPQMFADVLGIPIRVAECKETGALGAALCAGVGVGVWPYLSAAVQQAVQINPGELLPRPERFAFHDARYRVFKKLELAMGEMWRDVG
ncbi:carbohydrate kinase [Pantoea sp. Acro-805]|uniref:Carbohydrate kinase n=1 Tax=Candidatus Pantoea formicae TaxID=2608355 RepID=A0ABX0QUK6_9GAMM|nr:FGGY-family carbohydrate kinase [Pantoea formicae]MDF7649731.1 carbohydrate kinase [Erwiniaceae bacterium L1_54_3]NIF00444.1 carbohydrate kinase [Pantoea formicae]